jgi:predicted O-methyltransferase YrrM
VTGVASSLVLFWSKFDLCGSGSARPSREWIEYRFRHWLAFTLASVLEQDHGEFLYWLLCDPARRDATEPLRRCIRDDRVHLVYTDECPRLFRQLPNRDRYLVTRIDSDDLYHPAVASTLVRRTAASEFLQFNRGYACDVDSGQVRRWRSPSSPFYSHMYGPELRSRRSWREPNHTTLRGRATVLEPGRFLVALHQRNTSSSIDLGKDRLSGRSAREALGLFGLGQRRTLGSLLTRARGPAAWSGRRNQIRERLRPRYRRFVREASSEVMSISLETATLLGFLCEAVGARRILDLGAGFGSVVTRSYARTHPSVTCHAVTDDPRSLDRTRRFLLASGLPHDSMFLWKEFKHRSEPSYDLVLHDIGGMVLRAELLAETLDAVLPSGLVLLDDHHKPGYATQVSRCLERYCADIYPEVEELTRDRFGRCALLLGRVIGPLDRDSR